MLLLRNSYFIWQRICTHSAHRHKTIFLPEMHISVQESEEITSIHSAQLNLHIQVLSGEVMQHSVIDK